MLRGKLRFNNNFNLKIKKEDKMNYKSFYIYVIFLFMISQSIFAQLEINGDGAASIGATSPNSIYQLKVIHNTMVPSGKIGIYSQATGAAQYAYGLRADATSTGLNYGVLGKASNGRTNYGVYGWVVGSGYAGYFAGDVYSTGSYLPSDEKLKTNVKYLNSSLDKIMLLKPIKYNYVQNTRLNLPAENQYGLTAQDLEKVFPEFVKETIQELNPGEEIKKGEVPASVSFKAVNYNALIPILIKGMQEQQVMINELKKEIETLRKK